VVAAGGLFLPAVHLQAPRGAAVRPRLPIVDLFAAALTGHTDAGAAVFVPRTWPTAPSDMPMLGITPGPELKTGEGRSGAPAFTTAAVIRVMGRLTAKAEAGDAGAAALLGAMMVLQRQIERAVINEPNLRRVIQQFKSVKVTRQIETKETIVGDLAMDFEVEFYQPAEDFFPIDGDAIETLAVYADLINVFSPPPPGQQYRDTRSLQLVPEDGTELDPSDLDVARALEAGDLVPATKTGRKAQAAE
jgi:hypothetical protein